MGVDYYSCQKCGDSFPDCGRYVTCNDDCGNKWCCDTCAYLDGYATEEDGEEADFPEEFVSCKYCRKEDAEDSEILEAVLKKYKITRKKALEIWKDNQ